MDIKKRLEKLMAAAHLTDPSEVNTLANWIAATDAGLYFDPTTGEGVDWETLKVRSPESARRIEEAQAALDLFQDEEELQ